MVDHGPTLPEPYDKEELNEKRFEKIETRLKRVEFLLEKLTLTMGQPGRSAKIDQLNEKIAFLEKNGKLLGEKASKLAQEESVIRDMLLTKRRENDWFRLIMHDCSKKFFKDNDLFCHITGKKCAILNCPRIDELDQMMKEFDRQGPR